jgi:hypothetical protein
VKVRVPVQQFAERLDGRDHAGYDIVAAEQAADFGLEARPDEQVTQWSRIKHAGVEQRSEVSHVP